jgi:hypothetical protein
MLGHARSPGSIAGRHRRQKKRIGARVDDQVNAASFAIARMALIFSH